MKRPKDASEINLEVFYYIFEGNPLFVKRLKSSRRETLGTNNPATKVRVLVLQRTVSEAFSNSIYRPPRLCHLVFFSCFLFPFLNRATDARWTRHWTSWMRATGSSRWLPASRSGREEGEEDGEGSGGVAVLRPSARPAVNLLRFLGARRALAALFLLADRATSEIVTLSTPGDFGDIAVALTRLLSEAGGIGPELRLTRDIAVVVTGTAGFRASVPFGAHPRSVTR